MNSCAIDDNGIEYDVLEVVTNKYKDIAHFYCISGEHLTVHEVDCLGEETVLVPGYPGICGSEAPARWQEFKDGVTWV